MTSGLAGGSHPAAPDTKDTVAVAGHGAGVAGTTSSHDTSNGMSHGVEGDGPNDCVDHGLVGDLGDGGGFATGNG